VVAPAQAARFAVLAQLALHQGPHRLAGTQAPQLFGEVVQQQRGRAPTSSCGTSAGELRSSIAR
jgi:hypothetical protein